jgi:Nif-specific regulatory protein
MSRVRIVVVRGGEAVSELEADGDVVRIGRAPSSDVRLDDDSVAFEHARVHAGGRDVALETLDGNPTSVLRGSSRHRIEEGKRFSLETSDVIEFGADDAERAITVRVHIEPETEPLRIVETRPLSALPIPARAAATSGDAVLRTLSELQRRIGAADDLDGVLSAVADAALVVAPRATHATLILRDETEPDPNEGFVPVLTRVRGAAGAGASSPDAVRVARSVFRKVVSERAAVLAADAPTGDLSSESLLGASIRSTLGVPLWKGERILGVLQIDNRAMPAMFTSADVDAIAVLAANASLAVANARLIHRLELAEEKLERENRFLKGRERARREGATPIIGTSRAMLELASQLEKVADTRVSVLIEGETGAGKELVASRLHYASRRRERLLVAQNCAALPENLLESELFGHRRGAFTGATEDRKGLFEVADGGTLFLDEVTEMPLGLQAKLLRVLQEGEVRPLGSTQMKHVDVRIVAATNRNIEKEVEEGRFRQDLYYRLKVFPLRVPALRERRDDIPLLANHFLARSTAEIGKAVAGFTQSAMELLTAYDFPGNVRELENEVQRLVIQVDAGGFLTPELLSPKIRKVGGLVENAGVKKGTLKEMVERVERHFIVEALREHGDNKTSAAKALGITREGLHKKIRQLKL